MLTRVTSWWWSRAWRGRTGARASGPFVGDGIGQVLVRWRARGGDCRSVGGKTEVGKDADNDVGVGDEGGDAQAAPALGAVADIGAEHAPQQRGPVKACVASIGGSRRCVPVVVVPPLLAGARWVIGHDGRRGHDAGPPGVVDVENRCTPNLVLACRRDQGGQACEKVDRVDGEGVFAGGCRATEAVQDATLVIERQAVLGERRSGAVSEHALEALSVIAMDRGVGMEREPVDKGRPRATFARPTASCRRP